MTKSALELVKRFENPNLTPVTRFQEIDIWPTVEMHIDKFCELQAEFCARAKVEGWLGHRIPKNNSGLLGYLRNGFAIQLKILNKYKIALPIWNSDFVGFFRSDWFINLTLQNDAVKPIYKKEHFELIKRYNL